MNDPAESVGPDRIDVAPGVELEYEPMPGGKIRLAAFHESEPIHSGEYNLKILGSDTLKGQFINKVKYGLSDVPDVDPEQVANDLRSWFAEMHELDKEQQKELLLPPEIQAIIDGTEYPIEVHGGETTTWHVTLEFAGRTQELEFTASEMVSDSGNALREKIANNHFELVEIEQEDWEAIRERWQENKHVVDVVDETAEDTIADRVIEYLSNNITVVSDQEKLVNDPGAAWYDVGNTEGVGIAGPDAEILWVQDNFLVDQLEHAGQNIENKSKIIKTLNQRGDLHGVEPDGRHYWPNSLGKTRAKFYAFKPEALGKSIDDVSGSDDPNHSEVEA